MSTKEFKKYFCPFCKNKNTQDCEIRMTIDGIPKCPYYELDRAELKKYCGEKYESYINFVKDNLKEKLQKTEKKKCRL